MSMRNLQSSVKLAGIHGLHATGLAHLVAPALGVRGVILTFHEIQDDLDSELWTGCPTPFFERSIRWLRDAGWDPVTLDEALNRLHDSAQSRRFAVITFDDGYRDNITRALPILRREQVPFTIYIPTRAITRQLYAWWLGLRELFRINDKVEIPFLDRTFICTDLPSKRAALSVATRWAHDDFTRASNFSYIFANYGISLESLCDRYFINEDELRSLASDRLATIGAHTVTHSALATLGDADVQRELADNRAYLQDHLNRDINHFAYPYGSSAACGQREARFALEAGFRTAVTTSHRPLFTRDRLTSYTLPRIAIHPHSTVAHLKTETSGMTRATVRHFLSTQAGPHWQRRDRRQKKIDHAASVSIFRRPMSSQFGIPACDVAMVTLAFEGGGPERDSVFLCNALAAKGIRVAILALRKDGSLRSSVDPAIHVVDVLQPRMRYAIFGIRRAIRAVAPAIVVSSGIPSLNLATLVAVRSLPRAQRPKLVLREGAVPSMARHDPSRSNRIAYRILRHVYHHADRIITLTY
jgi:peptidoglycan/xylan/chitin deacetylase (PgdA/CDA1 family)